MSQKQTSKKRKTRKKPTNKAQIEPEDRACFTIYDYRYIKLQFLIELFRHNMEAYVFFQNVMRGLINRDEDLLRFVQKFKAEKKLQSKTQLKNLEKEFIKQKEVDELFVTEDLSDQEIEDIFSILERELEFG